MSHSNLISKTKFVNYHFIVFVEHQFRHSSIVHVYKITLNKCSISFNITSFDMCNASALSSNHVVGVALIEGSLHDSLIC